MNNSAGWYVRCFGSTVARLSFPPAVLASKLNGFLYARFRVLWNNIQVPVLVDTSRLRSAIHSTPLNN